MPKKFGEVDAKEFVSGAEVLLETENNETYDDSENSDEEWVDVSHSEDDLGNSDDDVKCDSDVEESTSNEAYLNETDQSISLQIPSILNQTKIKKVVSKKEQLLEKKEKAAQVSSMKILSDEDFKRIEIAQLSKQMTSAKNRKRPAEPDKTRYRIYMEKSIRNIMIYFSFAEESWLNLKILKIFIKKGNMINKQE